MNPVEDDLEAMLRHRAATIDISPSPSTALVRQGEVVRLRRRKVQLGLAAFVAAALIAPWALLAHGSGHDPLPPTHAPTPSVTPTSTPSPTLDSLPGGAPPTLPYLSGHALHVNGLSIPTTGTDVYAAGTTVLVEKWSQTDPTWWLLAGRRLVAAQALQGVFQVALTPDGALAAWWTNPNPQTSRIVAWNPRSQHEVAHTDLALPATCCDGGSIQNFQVDGHHEIYWTDAQGNKVWLPGAALPRIAKHTPALPGGPHVVSADGSVEASGSVVHDLRTGTVRSLAIPDDVAVAPIGFESDQQLLVLAYVSSSRTYVLRCAVATGSCVRALTPVGRSDWQFSRVF